MTLVDYLAELYRERTYATPGRLPKNQPTRAVPAKNGAAKNGAAKNGAAKKAAARNGAAKKAAAVPVSP
jgi:topoisomerase IA-like protein